METTQLQNRNRDKQPVDKTSTPQRRRDLTFDL